MRSSERSRPLFYRGSMSRLGALIYLCRWPRASGTRGCYISPWRIYAAFDGEKNSFSSGLVTPACRRFQTWIFGVAVFLFTGRLGVFGLGYDDLSDALNHGFGWKLAAALLAGKLISLTVACYGLGGCGGIFSPNLFFGGMCGLLVAVFGAHFLRLEQSDSVLLAVGGMSACLGAVVQAPVTAILIIFEMTHQFALVPGLMLAGLISQLIARAINHANFYDEILQQDGHDLRQCRPPWRDLRSWQSLPVSAMANFNPVVVTDRSEASLADLLRRYPLPSFSSSGNGKVTGIATRAEMESAVAQRRPLNIDRCLPVSLGSPLGFAGLAYSIDHWRDYDY